MCRLLRHQLLSPTHSLEAYRNSLGGYVSHSGKKVVDRTPPKKFRRKVKASKCVQGLKKRIKNSAEPSLAEPFLSSVGKIQNPDGFGLNPNGFGLNPEGSIFSRRNLFCSAELKKRLCKRGFCRIFYPFFETLDASGCFYFSAKPFWGVRSTTFFFRAALPE